MRKSAKNIKLIKNPWKELGMMVPSREVVIKNTAIVVAAISGMTVFVFTADTFTTWLLKFL